MLKFCVKYIFDSLHFSLFVHGQLLTYDNRTVDIILQSSAAAYLRSRSQNSVMFMSSFVWNFFCKLFWQSQFMFADI